MFRLTRRLLLIIHQQQGLVCCGCLSSCSLVGLLAAVFGWFPLQQWNLEEIKARVTFLCMSAGKRNGLMDALLSGSDKTWPKSFL